MNEALIIGGGLSGLSLALRLTQRGDRVTLLEKREAYLNDRTWCFWNTHPHPFEHLVEYRWKKWQVCHGGQKKSYSSNNYEYQMISSLTFYKEVLKSLLNSTHVSVHMGVDTHHILSHKDHLEAITSRGSFKARYGYDSRPTPFRTSFYQHFFGWHILSDTPSFDPSEVILMDFEVDQSKGIHFMYVLPFSSYEALIEPTFLSAKPLKKPEYETYLKSYLMKRFGIKSYEIIREEQGVLPLATEFQKPSSPHLTYIGAQAGWTRSSTGYAFLAIQEAVDHLIQGSKPQKNLERWLDRIFLSYLKNHPNQAPELFAQLFEKNDSDTLVRFLSSKSSMKETIQVISSLPKWPFMKELFV